MQDTLRIGHHIVPGIWEHMLPEEFRDFRFPAERFSSCSRCPMVVSDGYNSSYKCCTHIPRVPNFLMGQALRKDDSAKRIRKSISDGFALPEGIVITPAQSIATLKQNEAGNFGKTAEVRCGFLDPATGGCGIYHFRNATCSTFFCKNDFGPAGADFWEQVQATVGQVEYALSWWCMQEMGFDPDAYLARFDSLAAMLRAGGITSWNWPEEVHRVLWDKWFEREEEFFLGCADLVEKHQAELFAIACRTPLRKPEEFEEAFRDMLPGQLQRELDLDSPRGTPEPVDSVWYKLLLMHRNLWLLPDGEVLFRTAEGLATGPNPLSSALDKHNQALPWRISANGRHHYLTDAEYKFLTAFREPKTVTHEFLDSFAGVDGWSYFLELRHRKFVTEVRTA
jgi:Fe-S-cluster containining protein